VYGDTGLRHRNVDSGRISIKPGHIYRKNRIRLEIKNRYKTVKPVETAKIVKVNKIVNDSIRNNYEKETNTMGDRYRSRRVFREQAILHKGDKRAIDMPVHKSVKPTSKVNAHTTNRSDDLINWFSNR
jgi:hypothetical protein